MEQTQPMTETPLASSFMTRVTNVFTSPGELFSEVAVTPVQSSSWALPFIFSLLLGVVATFAIYNNPSLRQQIYDMQAEGMTKAVAEGKMTQEQMERASDQMTSSGPVMFMVIGGGSAVVMISIVYFGATLILWFAAKLALKFSGGYKKTLEVFGLTSMIGVLGTIITLLMMNVFDSMHATPGGAMLIMDSFDKSNVGHNLLASANIFTIWECAVIGIGLSKLSGKSTGMGIGLVLGLWAVWAVCASLLGWVR